MGVQVPGLVTDAQGRPSCWWHGGLPDYAAYHDDEWGRPVRDDIRLFEKICLEGFQAGLSWLTILRKRAAFRSAFAGFDFRRVAQFDDADIQRLVGDAGIVRHRGKIASTINNARLACDLADERGSLAAFVWQFEPAAASRPARCTYEALSTLTATEESAALSKALRRRGWTFVGPTTMYAFMQAVGLVNDHVEGCWARDATELERQAFVRP
ncbi:MAG: DNA-3-methyladenine glycosylase I [Rhodospirillaceae bacterium]|nr:DNA-3-methyladenine glycosylase I [Rhodospirillaceae bacterium]